MIRRLIKKKRLLEGCRVFKELEGRTITILCHEGNVYCFDTMCSHMGGALGEKGTIQDIEDSAGVVHSCIVCPAHSRKFDLSTGQQVTTNLAGEVCKSAQEQRVHALFDGGDGWWWVNIYEGQDRIASDKYNVLPPPMLDSHGWEEEAHPWPLAEPPDVISSSQESASSSAPLVPYGGGRFAVGTSSPSRKRSQSSDQTRPAARQTGFADPHIPFRNSKNTAPPPPHKATAWSSRRGLIQPRIGSYFPPAAPRQPTGVFQTFSGVPGQTVVRQDQMSPPAAAPLTYGSQQQAVDMDMS